ncbi:hypothetical protein [Geodermatophilus ruber]|uniref:Uncharacterized protein n=1 Tax=Geodermatophilus ruber TaxID=504800 RepID=A0A1I4AAA8_9ACTN|nr:hypothetical protein [Geodermatophilus ruber]SFK53325.1 hypothetical protein SAMN04488085_102141 [Geodermatophilus ruber]
MSEPSRGSGRSVASRALALLDASDGRHRYLTLSQIARRADPALARGLNTHDGQVTNEAVAAAHGLDVVAPEHLLR